MVEDWPPHTESWTQNSNGIWIISPTGYDDLFYGCPICPGASVDILQAKELDKIMFDGVDLSDQKKPDWSKAPEMATHYDSNSDKWVLAHDDGCTFSALDITGDYVISQFETCEDWRNTYLIKRPVKTTIQPGESIKEAHNRMMNGENIEWENPVRYTPGKDRVLCNQSCKELDSGCGCIAIPEDDNKGWFRDGGIPPKGALVQGMDLNDGYGRVIATYGGLAWVDTEDETEVVAGVDLEPAGFDVETIREEAMMHDEVVMVKKNT